MGHDPPPPRRSAVQLLIETWFTADVRSLAAMRIGTAIVLLYDLAKRSLDLTAHYSDRGVLPRDVILDAPGWASRMSLHLLAGSTGFQSALFVLAGLCGCMLLAGYRTRLATIASFLLLVSLQARNPLVFFGGDAVLKMHLFWGLFLPWGDAFSFDARDLPESSRRRRICSGGVAACMIQVGIIYIFAAQLKTGAEWRSEYTALYYALSLDSYVAPVGRLVYRWPWLMKVLTFQAFWIEALAPLLLFFPVFTKRLRMLAVLLVLGLHAGILLTMHISFFPVINAVSMFIFLPSEVWDWPWRRGEPRAAVPEEPAAGPRPWHRSPRDLVPLLLVVYVLFFSLPIPDSWRGFGYIMKIDQAWALFAPAPLRTDGWWVLAGTLENGQRVDLLRGGAPVTDERPPDLLRHYGNTRWRKFYSGLLGARGGESYRRFHQFYCRRWNAAHEPADRVVEVEPVFYLEQNLPDYRTSEPRPITLGVRSCGRDL